MGIEVIDVHNRIQKDSEHTLEKQGDKFLISPKLTIPTKLPEHLKSGGILPFSGCVHDTNTACLSAIQLLLLFLDFLVRLRTVLSVFRIRKDISAGY